MKKILEIKNLCTSFRTDEGLVKAVNNISFDLREGEILGIVGESGSGKTVTGMSIIGLLPRGKGVLNSGEVLFEGKNLLELSEKKMQSIRGKSIAMIFQDPMTSLNPFLRISRQITEVILRHSDSSKKEALNRAIELLQMTGIPRPEKRIFDYPHQFSGGMRQRIVIAMALSCNPRVIIADEPTTALDVTIQAQVLEIIQKLSQTIKTSVILITHDLGVVAGMCDRVNVMYAGKMVEKSSTEELFEDPKHPYTWGLLNSLPRTDKDAQENLYSIPGQPPHLVEMPNCCPFHPRCEYAHDACYKAFPPRRVVSPNREVFCWHYGKEKKT